MVVKVTLLCYQYLLFMNWYFEFTVIDLGSYY